MDSFGFEQMGLGRFDLGVGVVFVGVRAVGSVAVEERSSSTVLALGVVLTAVGNVSWVVTTGHARPTASDDTTDGGAVEDHLG